eukprot:3369398-Pleurochrysis_carterae.AAC.2
MRGPGLVGCLSPRALRLGQSSCQWAPLHQRQGAHFSLHFSFGSGRGRLGSVGLPRFASPRTANACAELGLDSSSRRTLRAFALLSILRAAPMVSARSPTPALNDSLTSSRVGRLSLSRRTAFATFSESTVSGSWANAGSERLSRCIECTNALNATTVGSLMPLISCECIMTAMVALVAVEAAFASFASARSNSLPLSLQARAYVRRAAGHVIASEGSMSSFCDPWHR